MFNACLCISEFKNCFCNPSITNSRDQSLISLLGCSTFLINHSLVLPLSCIPKKCTWVSVYLTPNRPCNFSHRSIPVTLDELKRQALHINNQYRERQGKKQTTTSIRAPTSSESSTTPRSNVCSNTSTASKPSEQKDLSGILNTMGHLTEAEKEQQNSKGLCPYCSKLPTRHPKGAVIRNLPQPLVKLSSPSKLSPKLPLLKSFLMRVLSWKTNLRPLHGVNDKLLYFSEH